MSQKGISTRRSAIVWRGPSVFTGNPVQIVMTGIDLKSVNEKTGPMVQISVLPEGRNPSLDFGTLRERDVCGDCVLVGRGARRVCYAAYLAWLHGQHMMQYRELSFVEARVALAGKSVRVGSYGDPAAVPFDVWNELLVRVDNWTGYTHAWRTCDQRFRHLLMASVETTDGYLEARRMGWRTFRLKLPSFAVHPGEIRCPYETHGVQCVKCRLCCGTERPAKSVVVNAHGVGAGGSLRFVQKELFI